MQKRKSQAREKINYETLDLNQMVALSKLLNKRGATIAHPTNIAGGSRQNWYMLSLDRIHLGIRTDFKLVFVDYTGRYTTSRLGSKKVTNDSDKAFLMSVVRRAKEEPDSTRKEEDAARAVYEANKQRGLKRVMSLLRTEKKAAKKPLGLKEQKVLHLLIDGKARRLNDIWAEAGEKFGAQNTYYAVSNLRDRGLVIGEGLQPVRITAKGRREAKSMKLR